MNIKNKVLFTSIGVCLVFSSCLFAFANKAEDSLSKGKKLYADGKYEEAMDSFIDVFVSGNPDQISEANEYVNLIHFDRGGVVPPKQIPYNKEIEDKQNIGVQGKNLLDKSDKKVKESKTEQPNRDILKEVSVKNPAEDDIAEPPASIPEADPFAKPEVVAKAPADTPQTTKEVKKDKGAKQPKTPKGEMKEEQTPVKPGESAAAAAPVAVVAKTDDGAEDKNNKAEVARDDKKDDKPAKDVKDNKKAESDNKGNKIEPVVAPVPQETIIAAEDSFPKGSDAKVRALQKEKEEQKRLEMRDEVLARLSKKKDVQVYMRGGRVDAIDIPSDVLFKDKTLNKNATSILDDVYSLMILENAPAYYILPEGSYTDEVTIQGVRQAVNLNSYMVNRGISPGKMNLNMGLSTQEPPEKFRNLAGVSVVFDYEGKTRLKSKLQEKNLPPILSLAVYPFNEITPALDEVFVIDFSVIEASAPIKKWTMQIVSRATDDHFYVVKQFSGDDSLTYKQFSGKDALAHQVFWNGRKRYFGQLLPTGNYTIVLSATDTEGRERILKRKVVLKDAPKKVEKAFVKTEAEVIKEENKKKAKEQSAKTGVLDYNQKRLWNKPSKKAMSGAVANKQAAEIVNTEKATPAAEANSTEEKINDVAKDTTEAAGATQTEENNPYEF